MRHYSRVAECGTQGDRDLAAVWVPPVFAIEVADQSVGTTHSVILDPVVNNCDDGSTPGSLQDLSILVHGAELR
jgi:hypothetical protein